VKSVGGESMPRLATERAWYTPLIVIGAVALLLAVYAVLLWSWLRGGTAERRPGWPQWPAVDGQVCIAAATARAPCANAMPATIEATSRFTWRLNASFDGAYRARVTEAQP
jgi:hypothetical protein